MMAYDILEMMEEQMIERFEGMLINEAIVTLESEGWTTRLDDDCEEDCDPDEYSEAIYIELSDVYGWLHYYDECNNIHDVVLDVELWIKE